MCWTAGEGQWLDRKAPIWNRLCLSSILTLPVCYKCDAQPYSGLPAGGGEKLCTSYTAGPPATGGNFVGHQQGAEHHAALWGRMEEIQGLVLWSEHAIPAG